MLEYCDTIFVKFGGQLSWNCSTEPLSNQNPRLQAFRYRSDYWPLRAVNRLVPRRVLNGDWFMTGGNKLNRRIEMPRHTKMDTRLSRKGGDSSVLRNYMPWYCSSESVTDT